MSRVITTVYATVNEKNYAIETFAYKGAPPTTSNRWLADTPEDLYGEEDEWDGEIFCIRQNGLMVREDEEQLVRDWIHDNEDEFEEMVLKSLECDMY